MKNKKCNENKKKNSFTYITTKFELIKELHTIASRENLKLAPEETIKLTGFSSGDKLYAFIRGFYGLKGLPNFFTKQMSTFFRSLIDKRSALVYIDDILLLANEKQEMFELIKELHTIASRENLKLSLDMKLVTTQTNSIQN